MISLHPFPGACMITERFTDDQERGIAFSRGTSGVALGVAGELDFAYLSSLFVFFVSLSSRTCIRRCSLQLLW